MKKENYISIEKEFDEDRLSLPNIGERSIPSPFTKFGKSLDGILRNGGFRLEKVYYEFDGESGDLSRYYKHDKSNLKIQYYNEVILMKNFEFDPEIPEKYIDITDEDNIKFDPNLFYDLYSRDNSNREDVKIETDKSGLWISNSKGIILENQELMDNKGESFYLERNKMFYLDGEIDYEDKHYFFLNNKAISDDFVEGKNKIKEMYLSKDAVLNYISNVVTNLSKVEK